MDTSIEASMLLFLIISLDTLVQVQFVLLFPMVQLQEWGLLTVQLCVNIAGIVYGVCRKEVSLELCYFFSTSSIRSFAFNAYAFHRESMLALVQLAFCISALWYMYARFERYYGEFNDDYVDFNWIMTVKLHAFVLPIVITLTIWEILSLQSQHLNIILTLSVCAADIIIRIINCILEIISIRRELAEVRYTGRGFYCIGILTIQLVCVAVYTFAAQHTRRYETINETMFISSAVFMLPFTFVKCMHVIKSQSTSQIILSVTEVYNPAANDVCAVCLFSDQSKSWVKLNCGHITHAKCAGKWYTQKNVCPLCRVPIINVQTQQAIEETNT